MDELEGSENNAKVSDSAYSNSCSNSQSRRSHSSKSTHSGSHSSRSSGYGGKPSIYSDKSGQPAEKRSKDSEVKHKAQLQETRSEEVNKNDESPIEQLNVIESIAEEIENEGLDISNFWASDMTLVETDPSLPAKAASDVAETASPEISSSKDDVSSCNATFTAAVVSGNQSSCNVEGFSCVISMHDGVVMYTTPSLTASLGFPMDMWVGRSFIDFVHSRDRNTFASHITSGLAMPKNSLGTLKEAPSSLNSPCTMVCRIRRYRGLSNGFNVKGNAVSFMPFLLKLHFKNISDDDGKVTYLVVQATPFFSAFKSPNESVLEPVSFVIRHAANGNLEYIDPQSVPYLGYLPQDLEGKDALMLYHPDDLTYLLHVYETIVKEGGMPRSKPFRMLTQNWDFIKVETEWSSFINPWTKKLEFVIGKHHILEGPTNPDVFGSPIHGKTESHDDDKNAQFIRDSILRVMNEYKVLTKLAEVAKLQMTKRCQDLASFMENLVEDHPKAVEEIHLEIQDHDNSYFERDSVMLGGISPHHDLTDSKSSVETTLSYNQINYNETLQRYFDSYCQPYCPEDYENIAGENVLGPEQTTSPKMKQSSKAQTFGSGELSSGNGSAAAMFHCSQMRLTESLLNRHNTDMEKELMKRSSNKEERKKVVKVNRQKKKEHLARCNIKFQPTLLNIADVDIQAHGTKRALKQSESEVNTHKHHCTAQQKTRRKQITSTAVTDAPVGVTTTPEAASLSHWRQNSVNNNINTFVMGVGYSPPPMPIMSATTSVPAGLIPMYYNPASRTPYSADLPGHINSQFQQPMQCLMYGQAVCGTPFMCTPFNPQMNFCHTMQNPPINFPQDAEYMKYQKSPEEQHNTAQMRSSDDTMDRTDGESSYSSFYSSFYSSLLKTESGSAEESGDTKNTGNKVLRIPTTQKPSASKQFAKRKTDLSCTEQVSWTSELIYKYQVVTKNLDEVLKIDQLKMASLQQPYLVNEQLGQLYLDMQLEGVTSKLSLEEGITSSSSSGEESAVGSSKVRHKRQYSRLAIFYEEDAPLPPPPPAPRGDSAPAPTPTH